ATDPKDATSNDPFSDGDSKHHTPAVGIKSAGPNGPEVKQASGSTESNSKTQNPVDPLPTLPAPAPDPVGPKLPASEGPGLGSNDPKPSDLKASDGKPPSPKTDETKTPPKQSEPSFGDELSLDPKPPEPKANGPKAPSTSPSEPKPGEVKPAEQKSSEG